MSYSNFNTFKLFENVGINSSSDYALSMEPNGNNVSFHSSNSIDYNNVDIMSIKNIINKKQNEDLNLSSLTGTTINPVITINNNHSDCRIMTNLNVSGNINITNPLSLSSGGTGIGSVAKGDIFYASDNNTLTKLPAGSNGQIITIKNEIPSWIYIYSLLPLAPSALSITEEWIIGGYDGDGKSDWHWNAYNSGSGVTANAENNKSWHLFTQWTETPAIGSGTYQYSNNKTYNHYNYSNNGLTLSFNDNNFPNTVDYTTMTNGLTIETTKPYTFITKKNYYDGNSTINFTGVGPGGANSSGTKSIIFNFNKFMYLTHYEICVYIYNKTQEHKLYYLDEYTFEWVIIHNWEKKNGGVLTSSNGTSNVFQNFEYGDDTSGINNITRNPLVDLTTPYETTIDDDSQTVTPQNKPARTYRLTMIDTQIPTLNGATNGGYFSLLKGKIIY